MVNKKDLRGGVEKMREVAQLLASWADDLESSLAKKGGKKAAAADAGVAVDAAGAAADAGNGVVDAAPAVDSAVPSSVVPSFEEVRALLAGKSAAGYRTQVLALIRSFGAEKLSGVDESRFGELMAAAERLGTDGGSDAG